MAAADTPLLLLNAPLVASRLGYPDLSGLDLLELFAFVHPARFVVPTPKGLAHALGLEEPASDDDVPALLQTRGRRACWRRCAERRTGPSAKARGRALQSLARLRWPWAQSARARISPAGTGGEVAVRPPARMGGSARAAAARAGRARPSTTIEARLERLTGDGCRTARRPARPMRARPARIFAPRDARKRAAHAAGAGGHRHRQDAGLSRARLAVGGEGAAARSGSRPSPRTCSASCGAESARAWPERAGRRQPARWWSARGARTTCACSISKTRCRAGLAGARRSWRSWSRAGPPIRRTAT